MASNLENLRPIFVSFIESQPHSGSEVHEGTVGSSGQSGDINEHEESQVHTHENTVTHKIARQKKIDIFFGNRPQVLQKLSRSV